VFLPRDPKSAVADSFGGGVEGFSGPTFVLLRRQEPRVAEDIARDSGPLLSQGHWHLDEGD